MATPYACSDGAGTERVAWPAISVSAGRYAIAVSRRPSLLDNLTHSVHLHSALTATKWKRCTRVGCVRSHPCDATLHSLRYMRIGVVPTSTYNSSAAAAHLLRVLAMAFAVAKCGLGVATSRPKNGSSLTAIASEGCFNEELPDSNASTTIGVGVGAALSTRTGERSSEEGRAGTGGGCATSAAFCSAGSVLRLSGSMLCISNDSSSTG